MAKLIKVDDIKWQSTQNGGWERPYEYVTKQDIDRMPAVDAVEVVHGRWEARTDAIGFVRCSVCRDCNIYDEWADGQKWNYCPNCGARMDLEVKDA